MLSRRQLLRLAAGVLAAPPCAAIAGEPNGISLRILATTDLHAHVMPFDYYRDRASDSVGLARLGSLIEAARADCSNTLLLDNGDFLQGGVMGDFAARQPPGGIHPMIRAMTQLRYDAATLGNHDFDYGLPFLQRAMAPAGFPFTLANARRPDGKPWLRPRLMLDRTMIAADGASHHVKIGIFGVLPPQTARWDRQVIQDGLSFIDIVDAGIEAAKALKGEGADVVIALCHSGFGQPGQGSGAENAAFALTSIPGIDALVAGHTHGRFPSLDEAGLPAVDVSQGTINGVPVVMPGFYGSHLGVIDLSLNPEGQGWKVTGGRGSLQALRHSPAAPLQSIVSAAVADHKAARAYAATPIGETTVPLNSYFSLVRPDALTALIATASRWAAAKAIDEQNIAPSDLPLLAAAAPFRTGGKGGSANHTDIPAGRLALRNVADLYPFPNTLALALVTGGELREWLEMSASLFHQIQPGHARAQRLLDPAVPGYDFDAIHGVTYTIDITQPPRYRAGGTLLNRDSHRIGDLAFKGGKLKDDQRLVVATNSYRASGGGNFPGLDGIRTIYHSPDVMQDVMAAWLAAQASYKPDETPPWRFKPLSSPARATFQTALAASGQIPDKSGIAFLKDAGDGMGEFQIEL